MTQSTEENGVIFSGERVRGHSYGEQHQVEDAVMASEIEANFTNPARSGNASISEAITAFSTWCCSP